MATYDDELLDAARQQLFRAAGRRGRLPGARIRRSVSTAYYAIFHFLLHETGVRLIGKDSDFRRRRRAFARTLTHAGMKSALDKVRGPNVESSVAVLFGSANPAAGAVSVPAFARDLASAFSEAQTKRLDADYDLNKPLSELDARLSIERVENAIAAWRAARTAADRDFKHALCVLMPLKGQLKREN